MYKIADFTHFAINGTSIEPLQIVYKLPFMIILLTLDMTINVYSFFCVSSIIKYLLKVELLHCDLLFE